jgi:hypothetical protein
MAYESGVIVMSSRRSIDDFLRLFRDFAAMMMEKDE